MHSPLTVGPALPLTPTDDPVRSARDVDVIRSLLLEQFDALSRLADEDIQDRLCGSTFGFVDAADKVRTMSRLLEILQQLAIDPSQALPTRVTPTSVTHRHGCTH